MFSFLKITVRAPSLLYNTESIPLLWGTVGSYIKYQKGCQKLTWGREGTYGIVSFIQDKLHENFIVYSLSLSIE